MRRLTLLSLLAMCLAVAAGCSRKKAAAPPPGVPRDDGTTLSGKGEGAPVEWLGKPRKELTDLDAKAEEQLAGDLRITREQQRLAKGLLPLLRVPNTMPVFQEAKFDESAGLSRPPYLAAGVKDSGLARHLARFGDLEAARKLAEDADIDEIVALHQANYGKNYPVEWSRLVGRSLMAAQYRVLTNDVAAVSEVLHLHKQVGAALDDKAKKSPLGCRLLGEGRVVLREASAAWRKDGRVKLADQIDAELKSWGEVPRYTPSVRPGDGAVEVARLLGVHPGDRALLPPIQRALDVLDWPADRDNVEGVVARFDRSGKLAEVITCYRGNTGDEYPTPSNLAHPLEDRGTAATDAPEVSGLRKRRYALAEDLTMEVSVSVRNGRLGGLARLLPGNAPEKVAPLDRDFGLVHLDRPFERNRVELTPQILGASVETSRADVLARLEQPLREGRVSHAKGARLERDGDADVVGRFVLRCTDAAVPFHRLTLGLWEAAPTASVEAADDANGGHIAIVWQDARTVHALKVPNIRSRAPELELRDKDAGSKVAERAAAARASELAQRKDRIASKRPWLRLPRSIDPSRVALGMTRKEATAAMPRSLAIAGGMAELWEAAAPTTTQARQCLVRFGPDDRVAELRMLMREVTIKGKGTTSYYAGLVRVYGEVDGRPSPWEEVWQDLPRTNPVSKLYRWQDDLTAMTCQRSGDTLEVVLLDCPPAVPEGVSMPPLTHLPRGPEVVHVGQFKADALKALKVNKPPVGDDPVNVRLASGGMYEGVLVWFDRDRVARIVAQHVLKSQPRTPTDRNALMEAAWARMLPQVGCWSRLDTAPDKGNTSMGWCDDQTRLRLYWQDDDTGVPRLMTEWVDLKGR